MHAVFKGQNTRKPLLPSSRALLCDPDRAACRRCVLCPASPTQGPPAYPECETWMTPCVAVFEASSSDWELCEVWVTS